MQKRDLIRVCLQNLLRRKSRTLLTVLGVIIGCCSIVIMVSIGIGMKESQQKMLSEMGDLTIITVSPRSVGKKGAALDDKMVAKFKKLPGVEAATPKISGDDLSIKLYAGSGKRYVCEYTSLSGLDATSVEKLGYKILNGGNIEQAANNSVLLGQYFEYSFMDTMRPSGYNMVDLYSMYNDDGTKGEPPEAYFDPFAPNMAMTMEVSLGEGKSPLVYELKPAGRVKEDYSKGYETSQGVIFDIKALAAILADEKNASGSTSTGSRQTGYRSVLVKVSDITKVADIEKKIKKLGFQTESMESIREPMEREARQKQLMLGGLGAISLFVAALGITNTMIMSISERTREIGIMKSLGCYVSDIRTMFLMEAGAIGLIGGIAGSVISVAASFIMNIISIKDKASELNAMLELLSTPGNSISVVPMWLIAFAIVFSIFIGLGSGYYPANKAVRIPALEAIKSE